MLPISHPLWAILTFSIAALLATVLATFVPYFRQLVSSGSSRLAPLDGLRGLLAFGVFLHHSRITYGLMTAGTWVTPANQFYAFLGRGCVGLFFMASGFLFWSRTLDKPIQVERLLISRFFRIMPLYWAVMLVVFVTAGVISDWTLRVPPIYFRREIAFWLTGGYFAVPTINGIPTVLLNAGVTWSLLYEWWFYLVLPVIAVAAPPKRFIVALVVYAVLRYLAPTHLPEYAGGLDTMTGFAVGMSAAYLVRIERVKKLLVSRFAALPALIILIAGLMYNQRYPLKAVGYDYLSALLFFVIVSGNSLFGLLTRRWTLLMGHISYSVYLIHGLLLFYLVQKTLGGPAVQGMSPLRYWGWIAGIVGPSVVVVSAFTYRFIEAPFLGRASLSTKPARVPQLAVEP